jgi:hypothetical protein
MAVWLGCGGGSDLIEPPNGTLEVTTSTSGPEPDADGYTISIDGAAPVAIESNAARRTEGLAVGQHTVELSGIATNCAVSGGPSLTVDVTANSVAAASFAVACSATTGTIQVTTTSAGAPADPDGYQILLDGAETQPIGTGATVTISGVAPGTHAVGLGGLAANCAVVDGDDPRDVIVAAGATATVAIAVSCSPLAPPPAPGSISVTTATSGADQDPDGYAVTLDGGPGLPIGADGTLGLLDMAPGAHTVGLTGMSANCRIDGENPRAVTVASGTVASVAFSITCQALPPSTGTLEITTVTTGPNPDPDGYTFAIDGGDAQPIGVNATASVASVAAGAHALNLLGASANCTIGGPNPRNVSVPAGGTAQVTFTVTCTAATGRLQVTTTTTGSPVDADGYAVSVDGGTARAVGTGASVTFEDLEPRAHAVLLGGLAANCTVQGENPRNVTVAAGETASAAFGITCTATTGSLAVTIAGLPNGVNGDVTVTGPNAYSEQLVGTDTLSGLAPGSYTATAAAVTSGGTRYTASPTAGVLVAAADTASVTVTYGAAAGPSLNLRIDGWYLSQGVQTPAGDIPFVENRDGYLRVFVVANEANTAAPRVRVRLYQNGAITQTIMIPAPGASTPTSRDEGNLARSWNVKIPRALIGPGFAALADVDPTNAIPEKDENDNDYPAAGTPQGPAVRSVPIFGVRFVPVRQRVSGLQGDVSAGNRSQYLDLTRRMYPTAGTDGDVHAVYTTDTPDPLQPDDGNGAWPTILSEIDAMRVAEGTGRNYYGVVRIDYSFGIAGLGFIGLPTAMGYDEPADRGRVMAHELGHNWGRLHTPCGFPGDVDPDYPYPDGSIGVYGIDMLNEVVKPPTVPDIMGYCGNPWTSDYTYQAVLAYRSAAQGSLVRAASAAPRRCLLVWGRIVDGRPVLEPAFEIVTRPSLPKAAGAYAVEGLAADGARLFDLSFDAAPVADGRRDTRHFAFAVPLDDATAARLGSLRLSAPAGAAAALRASSPAAARVGNVVEARPAAGGVALRWDASAHPMIMVRDPDTGEVLSLARGGEAEVATSKSELDVIVSDRVGSRQVRVTVGR